MRKPKVTPTNITAVSGSSARALYAHHAGMLNNLEFTFVTDSGEKFTVTMEHPHAREFIDSAIAAYQATMLPLRIARQVPFGG
jgi:hypothetical protein